MTKTRQVFTASPDSYQNKKSNYIEPIQSANTLFHFIDEIMYLEEALEEQKLFPRYCEEKFDFICEEIPPIAFPMKCFCDIHLNKLSSHRWLYGGFGIAFKKEWGIDNGLQPIQYINEKSSLEKKYCQEIKKALNDCGQNYKQLLEDYVLILYDLFFIKPLSGKAYREDKGEIDRNFHDEKEWRFVPDIENHRNLKTRLIIPNNTGVHKKYDQYSDHIKSNTNCFLSFAFEDIKYLIVENYEQRNELIEFIRSKLLKPDPFERDLLISKILVFDDLKGDW